MVLPLAMTRTCDLSLPNSRLPCTRLPLALPLGLLLSQLKLRLYVLYLLQRGVLQRLHAASIDYLGRGMLLLLLMLLLLRQALLKLLLGLHDRLRTTLQGCRHRPAALHCIDSMLLLLLLLMQTHCLLRCRRLVTGLLLLPLVYR